MMPENGTTDPVERFRLALAEPPTEFCEHIDSLAEGEPAVRDARRPQFMSCVACYGSRSGPAACATCGAVDPGSFFALLPGSTLLLWGLALLCPPCASWLPEDVPTWQQEPDGSLRVNRPQDGAR